MIITKQYLFLGISYCSLAGVAAFYGRTAKFPESVFGEIDEGNVHFVIKALNFVHSKNMT